MFLDIQSVGKDKIAHLVTPGISPVSDNYCVTFWFFITDPHAGRLTVGRACRLLEVLNVWTWLKDFSVILLERFRWSCLAVLCCPHFRGRGKKVMGRVGHESVLVERVQKGEE